LEIADLINCCLKVDPIYRMTAPGLLKKKIFKTVEDVNEGRDPRTETGWSRTERFGPRPRTEPNQNQQNLEITVRGSLNEDVYEDDFDDISSDSEYESDFEDLSGDEEGLRPRSPEDELQDDPSSSEESSIEEMIHSRYLKP